jgi:hypothetical protein
VPELDSGLVLPRHIEFLHSCVDETTSRPVRTTDAGSNQRKASRRALEFQRLPDLSRRIAGDVEVYPEELLHAVPGPSADRARAERWFAQKTRAGENAVRRMATLYVVLVEADPTKQPDTEKKSAVVRKPLDAVRPSRVRGAVVPVRVNHNTDNPPATPSTGRPAPGININLQVHISADATPDQIDQIFASMAKHIYPRG